MHFHDLGSLPTCYARNAERLALDEDVIAVCSALNRRPTTAPLRFETVEPLTEERGRIGSAVSLASFVFRATRVTKARRHEIDLVHVDGIAALDADIATVHNVRSAEAERYWTQVHPAGRARQAMGMVGQPTAVVEEAVERRLHRSRRRPPLCLAVTRTVAADLERVHGVPPERIEVVPYPIDVGAFRFDPEVRAGRRAALAVHQDRMVLLFVGDDLLRKGLPRAIAALARSTREDVELWVAGGHDVASFEQDALRAGVGDRVRLFGRRPIDEIPGLYAAADVVVLPSEQDVWGIPVVEGLAAGRIVVVSEFAGAHELIRDGENGFVLERRGEPDQLAALIDGALWDPELRRRVLHEGPVAAEPFDLETVYSRFRAAHHRAWALRQERLTQARSR